MSDVKKPKRPSIPKDVQLKLWVNSAGFCEFLGCNSFLLSDGLTLSEANYSNIAHIISWTETGPRGDSKLSPELGADYSNLMLMCKDHAGLIDNKNYVKDYPVDLLKTWKREHEDKVKLLITQYGVEKTNPLVLISKINGQIPEINFDEIKKAVAPRYPNDEKGILIDLTDFDSDNDQSLDTLARIISEKTQKALESGIVTHRPQHLSVFALAPIPLLVHLGVCLGDKITADLYQKQRSTQSWEWQEDPNMEDFAFEIIRPKSFQNKVAVVLSLSGKIHNSEIEPLLVGDHSIYEIMIEKPNRDFLTDRKMLMQFKTIYHRLLAEIRETHGKDCEIHMFPAVPAPIAVTCGQAILPKSDPPIFVYDKKKGGGFEKVLKVN
ncbi:MAG: SAVED domain-containing protein [Thermoleophilia bacterium]